MSPFARRLFAFVWLTSWPTAAQAAGTFYVDASNPSASDFNPGTEALPFLTISGASAAQNGPGTTILVKPGLYRETVHVPASGTAASPFVFRATAPGVILEGADDFSINPLWSPVSGNVYRATSVTWAVFQVFVDGERLGPSTAPPASMPANTFQYVPGTGLYVNAGGGNPGTHQTFVGRRVNAFTATTRTYVTIDGFTIRRYEDRAVNLQNASDNCVVRNNTITFNYRYGVAVNGCSGVLVERNVIGDNQDHGIALTNLSAGCTVQDNECYRSVDPAARAANGIYLNRSSGNLFQRNRTHDNQDTGLHIGSVSNSNLSIQNVSWNNGDHGFDHLDSQGTMDLGNVAYGNFKDGLSIEGSSSGGRVANCISIENGLTTNEFDLWVDAQSSVGFTSDYNVLWNSTPQPPVKYITTLYSSVAVYSTATGQDAHTIQTDPLFVSPATANFHLQAGSPAIDGADSGVPNWPLLDADGNGRFDDAGIPNTGAGPVPFADRGAFEAQGNTDGPPVVIAPGAVSGDENTLISFLVIVSDPNGDPISSLTAAGLPSGASFTKSPQNTSATLSWTPSYTQSGTYAVTFIANNSLNGTASTTITVNNVNGPPIINAPSTVSGIETATMTVNASAADPDGEAISSLTASNLPSGASFAGSPSHTSGTLTWTPSFTQAGSYPVTFTATNALSGTAVTTLQVANNDRPPTVSAPVHAGVLVPNTLEFTVTASDVDGEPIGSLSASGLPPRAHFTAAPNSQSGTFSWVTKKNDPGTYVMTFTASNALSGTAQTIITCTDVNVAPVVTSPAALSVRALETLTVNVDAYDPDGQAITSLTALGLPAGASFVAAPDHESGIMTWTPGVGDQGTRTVRFRAANSFADTSTTVITVNPPDQPPVVVAPASVGGDEAQPLSLVVSASDPDGDPLTSLTASPVPSGASFTSAAGATSGTLAWTPTYTQAGVYGVTFTVTNAKTGSAATSITIADVDAPPVVTAPPTASGKVNTLISFTVSATDPDGDPLAALSAEVPTGASFTSAPSNDSGTFTWTPVGGDIGTHPVTFTAQNVLAGTASTSVTVMPFNVLPSAQLTVTPSTGNSPLSVTANAAASSDADGTIVSYRFNFGDGTIVGPGPASSATHALGPGNWTVTVTVTDNDGGQASRFTTVLVAATPPQPNLVGNPSVESNTTGWGGYSGGVIQRVFGGFDGSWGLQTTGDSTSTVSFGCNDAPNWIGTVPAVNMVYRFTAWVRSQSHTGTAKIQVREYTGAIKVGNLYSNGVTLSPTWQFLTVDYLTVATGSTLDFQVVDFPLVTREVFIADNIGIRDVTGTTTAVEPNPVVNGMAPLKGRLTPSPLRSRSALTFSTTRPGPIRVTLFDVQGRRVRDVARETNASAGAHRYDVDGRAGDGGGLAAGVYFYRIEALEGSSSGRFVVLR
jgi:parallel beta-helix repeat protein